MLEREESLKWSMDLAIICKTSAVLSMSLNAFAFDLACFLLSPKTSSDEREGKTTTDLLPCSARVSIAFQGKADSHVRL